MSLRHGRWFATLAAVALGVTAAGAQPSQPPPINSSTVVFPSENGADRLQRLMASPTSPEVAPGVITLDPREPADVCIGSRRESRGHGLTAGWYDGLRFRSEDDAFHLHVGGNAQIDSTWLIAPKGAFALPSGAISGLGNASATFLRRARFRIDGDIYNQFDFVVEYDFANANNENDGLEPPSFGNITSSPAPANIWMQVRDVPLFGNVRLGNMVKPIGMTNNTFQALLPFLERADNMDAFYGPFDGGFALGVAAHNHTDNERVTWQYGVYRPSINVFGVGVNKFEWGGRVTALPIYADDGRAVVHIGLGTLNGELPQNTLRVRARPLLRNGPGFANPILVDTGDVPGSRQYTHRPGTGRGLWFVDVPGRMDRPVPDAGHANRRDQPGNRSLSWGLCRTALLPDRRVSALQQAGRDIRPHDSQAESAHEARRRHQRVGAWQVGLRFSYLDLNDKAIQGGMVYDWTAGLNWFWNPNMKVQLNYILERRDQPGVAAAWINGVGIRGAYDF